MTRYDHFIRLLALFGFVMGGLFVTAFCSAILMLMSGMSIKELMEMGQSGIVDFSPGLTRVLLAVQHLMTFILPGLAFGYLFYKPNPLIGLSLQRQPGWMLSALGILFLMAAYPLVNLTYMINEAILLPSWATAFEDQAEDTLMAILKMDNPLIFVANLILIAILPGIGEELIFRGIIQKETAKILRSPIAGIWISAFIFSAIHLQFEGFLPRMALGAVLGYIYYWTGNLWISMIVHAFNNGIQVALIYITGMDVNAFDEESSGQLQWWMIPLSILAMYIIYYSMLKNRQSIE